MVADKTFLQAVRMVADRIVHIAGSENGGRHNFIAGSEDGGRQNFKAFSGQRTGGQE